MNFLIKAALPLVVASGAGVAATGGDVDQLKAMGEEAIDIVYQAKTLMEVKGIAKSLKLDIIAGERTPRDLTAYIRRNMDSDADATMDAWGKRYELAKTRHGLVVRSCGPDARCGSDDDITAVVDRDGGR